jgi:hypothetical protein
MPEATELEPQHRLAVGNVRRTATRRNGDSTPRAPIRFELAALLLVAAALLAIGETAWTACVVFVVAADAVLVAVLDHWDA